jgi:recombination protein RecA
VVKNKVAAPFRLAEFDIEYGDGISKEGCILDLGVEHELIQKSGSFFSYGELRLGQGRHNSKQHLAENPELAREIEGKIYETLDITPASLAPVPDLVEKSGEEPAEKAEPAKKVEAVEKAEPKEKRPAKKAATEQSERKAA